MNYADTKRAMIGSYPSLFAGEPDVLEHLFFIIGNGYDWHDGQLTDGTDRSPEQIIEEAKDEEIAYCNRMINGGRRINIEAINKIAPDIDLRMFNFWHDKLDRVMSDDYIELEHAHDREYRLRCIKDMPDNDFNCWFLNDDGSIGKKISRLCDYSRIVNLPDDIQPDWLEAAKTAIEMSKDPKIFRVSESDRVWLDKAEKRIEELENR